MARTLLAFRMEDGRTVNLLLSQGDFLARLDLESAYFTVPVSSRSSQYLRFLFQGQLWEFVCLPFGLNIAPFVFTKVLKPFLSICAQWATDL